MKLSALLALVLGLGQGALDALKGPPAVNPWDLQAFPDHDTAVVNEGLAWRVLQDDIRPLLLVRKEPELSEHRADQGYRWRCWWTLRLAQEAKCPEDRRWFLTTLRNLLGWPQCAAYYRGAMPCPVCLDCFERQGGP